MILLTMVSLNSVAESLRSRKVIILYLTIVMQELAILMLSTDETQLIILYLVHAHRVMILKLINNRI